MNVKSVREDIKCRNDGMLVEEVEFQAAMADVPKPSEDTARRTSNLSPSQGTHTGTRFLPFIH